MLRKEAIARINAIHHKAFNDEQKQLACRILEKASDHEIKALYDFIIQRIKLGFTFDYAPAPNVKKISLIENQPNLNIIKTDNQLTHKLIIGDNFDGLKNLLITHRKKIDIIYIDPPYNTEAASGEGNNQFSQSGEYTGTKTIENPNTGKFSYRDKFARTGWLNMLNERLKLAKELLSDQGVIFVSIDDNEQAYLKVLMDEIFGEEHFICNFTWEKIYSTKSNNKFVSTNHDYILCYRKSNEIDHFVKLKRNEENNKLYRYDDNDGRGVYRIGDLGFPNGKVFDIKINGVIYKPGKNRGWIYSENKIYELIAENKIYIPLKPNGRLGLKRYLNEVGGLVTKTILPHKLVGHTDQNKRQLNEILDKEKSFDYPKGIKLIKYLIQLIPHNKNATVLDFYAGSGTIAHAVMDLNREDGGKRECILITNNENNIAYDVTYERLHRIIKQQGTKGETDFPWLNQKIDYSMNNLKVFVLKEHDIRLNIDIDQLLKYANQQLKQLDSEFNCDQDTLAKKLQGLYPLLKK